MRTDIEQAANEPGFAIEARLTPRAPKPNRRLLFQARCLEAVALFDSLGVTSERAGILRTWLVQRQFKSAKDREEDAPRLLAALDSFAAELCSG